MDGRFVLFVSVAMLFPTLVFSIVPQPDMPEFVRWSVFGTMFATEALSIAFLLVVQRLMKLTTEVRADGLTLSCPFLFKGPLDVPLDNVVSHKVLAASSIFALAWQNRPKMTAGLWLNELALRLKHRRVWMMGGPRAVRIDYPDGSFFLIGSRKPQELNDAIRYLLDSGRQRRASAIIT